MIRTASIAAIVAFAGSASAQFAPGSLLYISDARTTGGTDTINVLDYGPLTSSTLFTFGADTQDSSTRGGLAQGPNGEFYVHQTNFPVLDPSTASISRVDDLFGTASNSSFAMNPELQQVTGITYDSFSDSVLVLNNPGSSFNVPFEFEGLQSYDRATGSYDGLSVPETPNDDINSVGGGFVGTGRAAGQFYYGSLNGGVDIDNSLPGDGSRTASAIARTQLNNPADPLDDTTEILVDLSPSVTGASEHLGLLRGMDVLPNGNIVFLDANSFNIWEVALDANGDFDSLNVLFDGSAIARSSRSLGSGIIYNPFTDKLNYIEFTGVAGVQDIVEINLDGTGRTILASGLSQINSLVAIPAPASVALLGLGGLAAIRRRR
ncbi:MAG: PEP-CTERM sorting domain-containing protein [Planctomycetota bacterium]